MSPPNVPRPEVVSPLSQNSRCPGILRRGWGAVLLESMPLVPSSGELRLEHRPRDARSVLRAVGVRSLPDVCETPRRQRLQPGILKLRLRCLRGSVV